MKGSLGKRLGGGLTRATVIEGRCEGSVERKVVLSAAQYLSEGRASTSAAGRVRKRSDRPGKGVR